MAQRETCVFCNKGRFEKSAETARVPCNLRRFQQEQFTVWRCPQCASLHSLDIVDLAPYYKNYPINPRVTFFLMVVYRQLFRRLKRNFSITKKTKILDYGCGKGACLSFLRENGYDARGYDLFSETYSDKSVLKKNHYDLIILQDVLEHVEDPPALLNELGDYLKKDGILSIGTPNAVNIPLTEPYAMEISAPHHVHIASANGLRVLLDRTGFEMRLLIPKSFCDTPVPFVNWSVIEEIYRSSGKVLDSCFEKSGTMNALAKPVFWAKGFFGYFMSTKRNMLLFCVKK